MKFKSDKQRKCVMASLNDNNSKTSGLQKMKKLKEDRKAKSKEEALSKELKIKKSELKKSSYDDNLYETDSGEEYLVFDSYDDAERKAEDRVREDLENEPELFSKDWLKTHIDIDHLRDELESDVSNMNNDYYNDIERDEDDEYINRQREELYQQDLITEEQAKDEKFDTSDAVEKAVEKMTEEQLEDPMDYLDGIYGDDKMKEAIRIGGIDYDSATDEAISQDGVAHFLASYDGNETEKDGYYIYRVN